MASFFSRNRKTSSAEPAGLGNTGRDALRESLEASEQQRTMGSFFRGSGSGSGTASRVMYLAVTRVNNESDETATIAEYFVKPAPKHALALGRTMAARTPTPGWDDITCAGWRAIKLPIHDIGGCTGFVAVFGGDFDPKRAQATTERMALMLGPMLKTGVDERAAVSNAAAAAENVEERQAALANAQLLEEDYADLVQVMKPVLQREMEDANKAGKIQEVQDQIESVRMIMEQNVEEILKRQDLLEGLDEKAGKLETAARGFKKKATGLRRWHLMNQVKWGVAIGTMVTASVAIPIAIIVAA